MQKPAKRKKLLDLMRKYVDGRASDRESAFVEKYYQHFDLRKDATRNLSEKEREQLEGRMLTNIHRHMNDPLVDKIGMRRRIVYIRAAAMLIVLIAVGGILYFDSHQHVALPAHAALQHDIGPGTNGAILKLSGGRIIVLDTARNGQLTANAANVISKTDSTIRFSAASQSHDIEYYTIITPRARQQQIILSDGTKIWLNAGSSVRFPSAFLNKQRIVDVTGEAYFEVSQDVRHPFIVKVKDMRIEVLGTHFNVMAYDYESSVRTTLLEGSVRVTRGATAVLLEPGQEAFVDGEGKMQVIKDANLYEVVAWKNNLFWFENDDVKTVMKTLSRWYNVDIHIEGNIPDLFTGLIPRDLPFSKVFEVLQKTGSIHYAMKNDQIIVSP